MTLLTVLAQLDAPEPVETPDIAWSALLPLVTLTVGAVLLVLFSSLMKERLFRGFHAVFTILTAAAGIGTLGVVDDDTIHFINRYRKETAAGATTDDAIESATVHEGRASLTTALVNSLGFGVLMFSEYKPNAWFGGLLGLTMGVAFLSEVFILPASIKLVPRLFGAESVRGRSPLLPPTLPAVR